MTASRRTLAAAIVLVAFTPACSALLDWSDFTGGSGDDGGVEGGVPDATTDAAGDVTTDSAQVGSDVAFSDAVVPCGNGGTCAPNAPAAWMGPVALYVGAGAAPACDADAATLFDGKGDLVAPAATCSSCGCGAPSVSCADPVVTAYDTPACSTSNMTVTPTSSCSPIFAPAVTVAAPALSGSCAASGGSPTTQPPAWNTAARACPISAPGTCAGGSLCVFGQPASSSVCVMQSDAVTTCPASYPVGPQIFYTGVSDSRGCSACTCGAVSGVTCTIASSAVEAFVKPGCPTPADVTLSAPSTCTSLSGALFLELAATPVLSGQGSCAVSGGGAATGAATPTDATSFCCLP